MQSQGIMGSAKHFPGHGDTSKDSHKTLPTINFDKKRIDNVELYPYKELIKNKEATFFARVSGESMINAGLEDGDLIVIDRSLEPTNNKIAVCFIDGEFTVKRLQVKKNKIWLKPENKNYKAIEVKEDNELIIWGIVTNVIKKL